ncbi:helix-turn-helix transcriptional regulator [Herbaspirillum sp. 1173]|uniref:helix-turn-helix transcriptional regulator n=1 Tax=Herbaspirillum sp. 1173 TaxID=2817734 RepID=UPI0038D419DE
MQATSPSQHRCLSVTEVLEIVGLSRSTLYAMLADTSSDFPRALKIGRRTCFFQHELDAWLSSRPRLHAATRCKEAK